MRLKTNREDGPKTFSVDIRSNDSLQPTVRVRLRAKLHPLFRVEPKRAHFAGLFDTEKRGSFEITLHPQEPFDSFEVVPLGPNADILTVESIETLERGNRYRIHLIAADVPAPLTTVHRIDLVAHYPADGERPEGWQRAQRTFVTVTHEPRIRTSQRAVVIAGSRVNAAERTREPIVELVTLSHAVAGVPVNVVHTYCEPDPWKVFSTTAESNDDGSSTVELKLWSFPRGESHLRTQLIIETDDPKQPTLALEVVVYTSS